MAKKKTDLLCVADICAPKDIVDSLGWIGAISILAAYAAMSFGFVYPTSPLYQGLNLFGALGIVMSSLPRKAYQATTLNLVWAAIALIALLRMVIVN
ncbi:hypothetical protein HZC53_02520 [Candidatus Uhrbacteria bacterium]|nr:hypothetical protein [Candidatus Uhrbacteria bacterium]